MIWAGPGSGKTYLIEEIARNSPGVDFIPINFAKVGQSNLQQELEKVQSLDAPTLVLLDEVDARPSEDWLYQSTLPRLDINIERPHGGQTVFVLIGSKRGGREAMIRAMVSPGGKGDDMVRRVPIANRFDIPAATIEDRLVILCSQARTPAPDVVEIEKLAAYYILRTPEYDNPRHLRDLVHAAVNKRSESLRLTYEDLFQRRDAAKRRFLTQNENAADELENTYIKIE